MTSASELFYKRRSDTRTDRTAGNASTSSDLRLGLEYSINRHHTCRRDILDGGDGDHLRRSLHHRHRHYRASQAHQLDALPRSVVRARERLVERLGGIPISISSDRRSSRDPFIMARVEYNLYLDHHSAEQVSNRVSRTGIYGTGSANSCKKPPGLSQDAVDSLCSKAVCNNVSRGRGGKSSSSNSDHSGESDIVECSICLESLMEGDDVICLPMCNHTFHFTCLTPWITTCGDCPYCRQPIIPTITHQIDCTHDL